MWSKKVIGNFGDYKDYRRRGRTRRVNYIFFKIVTRKIHEVGTTKRRRH